MSLRKRRAGLAVIALSLLATVAGGFLGEYVHTDDGCAFETHCVVCQRHIGSLAVIAPSFTTPPALEPLGSPTAPPTATVFAAPVRGEAPRGPPQV